MYCIPIALFLVSLLSMSVVRAFIIPLRATSFNLKGAGVIQRATFGHCNLPQIRPLSVMRSFDGGRSRFKAKTKIQVDPENENFRASRLFVSGLPMDTDWKRLKDYFRDAGVVAYASVSKDFESGMSKGCGIIQFEDYKDAEGAIKMMDGSNLDGNVIHVRQDRQERKSAPTPVNKKQRKLIEEREKIDSFQQKQASSGSGSGSEGVGPPMTGPFLREDSVASYISNDLAQKIDEIMAEREIFRAKKDYAKADEIRIALRGEYRVQIDDNRRTWRVLSDLKNDGTPRN